MDFRNEKLYKYKWFYYFDPPYLITQVPYSVSRAESDERDLLNILDILDWLWLKHAHYLNRRYLNANYRKKNITIAKEVLITNY